jgi:hypothetical protein
MDFLSSLPLKEGKLRRAMDDEMEKKIHAVGVKMHNFTMMMDS